MKNFTFRYGSGTVTAALDEDSILGVLHGNPTDAIEDIPKALHDALESPTDSVPLSSFTGRDDTVCLVISDMSRFWMRQDRVIPPLIDYLRTVCGSKPENITILVANGTHEGGSEQELRTLVTDSVYDSVRVVNHDCLADDLVYMGTTSFGTPVRISPIAAHADRVICLGACVHHVMAGFGGGRKSILPGISGMETIRHNHAYSLDPSVLKSNPRIGNGKLEDNPLLAEFEKYDTVYVGFPIWYGCAPNVVNTFCKAYDWTGKKVYAFATSGGSGIGKTAEKLKPYVEGATEVTAKLVKSAEDIEEK